MTGVAPPAAPIRIGARPPDFAGTGTLFDGRTAAARPATLRVDDDAAILILDASVASRGVASGGEGAGCATRRWPLAALRRLPDQAGDPGLVLTHADDPLARLLVEDPEVCRVLAARCPNLHRRLPARGVAKLVGFAVAAVGAVALMLLVLIPAAADRLAVYLPPGGERALGDTTLAQIRRALAAGDEPLPFCRAAEGRAALDAMTGRLTEGLTLPVPLAVHVLDSDTVNAFALPGGHIVLFIGLIDAAGTPDEVAAVLAHEIGHVAARDPTRIALRSAGSVGVLGLLLGDFAGGALVLFLAERLIAADYGRAAETAADAFAVDRLARAGADPGALASLFARLAAETDEPPGIGAHFLNHPALADRIAAARDAPVADAAPLLDPAGWEALRGICA